MRRRRRICRRCAVGCKSSVDTCLLMHSGIGSMLLRSVTVFQGWCFTRVNTQMAEY